MSRRTLSIQQRQLIEQRRMLQRVVEVCRELPVPQNQAARRESAVDQQQHAANQ
jgi:hypothetical protein